MKTSSLIGHAIEALDHFHATNIPGDALLGSFFKERRYLGSHDRKFIAELFFGVLRHHRLFRYISEQMLQSLSSTVQEVPSILLCIAYLVKVARWEPEAVLPVVAGLVRISMPGYDPQTIVEGLQNTTADLSGRDDAERISLMHSMPPGVASEWIERYGVEEAELLCRSLNEQAPTVLRVNTLMATRDECRMRMEGEGIRATPTALAPDGLAMQQRFAAGSLTSFKEGLFEMQDEGSQILSYLVDPRPGDMVVDACAGAGGKSLHLAALMRNNGRILAMDVQQSRLDRMKERLRRAGVTIVDPVLVKQAEPDAQFTAGTADRVLIDAPCSGVGTFRRNPGAKVRFSMSMVETLAETQGSLIARYARLVKQGGRLVYATCSLLQQENESIVRQFQHAHPEFQQVSVSGILDGRGIQIPGVAAELSLLPHRHGTDGFYAAVFQRAN